MDYVDIKHTQEGIRVKLTTFKDEYTEHYVFFYSFPSQSLPPLSFYLNIHYVYVDVMFTFPYIYTCKYV